MHKSTLSIMEHTAQSGTTDVGIPALLNDDAASKLQCDLLGTIIGLMDN
jgi:hypothetical protein